jgi:hypothetical protein
VAPVPRAGEHDSPHRAPCGAAVIFGDPNAFLGYAPTSAAVLGICVVFLAGCLVTAWAGRVPGQRLNVGVLLYLWLALVGVVLYRTFGPFFLGTDGPLYDAQALGIAQKMSGELDGGGLSLRQGKVGWPTMLGVVYAAMGRVPLAGILINCAVVAVSAAITQKAAVVAWGRCSTVRLLAVFGLVPCFMVLGPSLMREPLCWLGSAMITYAVVHRMRLGTTRWAPLLAGALLLLWVRTLLGVLVIGGYLLGYLFLRLKNRYGWSLALVGVGLLSSSLLLAAGPALALAGQDFASVAAGRTYLADEVTTGFAQIPDYSGGALGLVTVALKTLPPVALGPFPWEIGFSGVWLWVLANSVAWWMVLVAVVQAARRSRRDDVVMLCSIAGLAVLIGMSAMLTNYGIVVRIRSDVLVMLAPVVMGVAARPVAGPAAGTGRPDEPGRPRRRRPGRRATAPRAAAVVERVPVLAVPRGADSGGAREG